jgi:farnesyl-diphosphate farnesyltransferase
VSWKPANLSQLDLLQIAYQKLSDSLTYILLIPKEEVGMRRFCLLAFGLAVLTLDKLAAGDHFERQEDIKLSRNTVWFFYGFTKIATGSNGLIKSFFYLWGSPLRKLKAKQ